MRKTWLIIKREYLTRVQKKSFIVITLLGPILLAAVLALIGYIGMHDSKMQSIWVIDDMAPVFDRLKDGDHYSIDYTPEVSLADAKKRFADSEYTAILWVPEIMDGNQSNRPFLFF